MRWLGLTPLGLSLALAGFGAAVVALYLLKQRPRRVVVPTIALWESLLGKRDAASLFTRFRRLWSLLLALLVMALILFALADLRREAPDSTRRVLIAIDASASMAATDEKPTRLEAAKRRAREIVQRLGPADRAMIVQLDAEATALSPATDDGVALARALSDVRQTDLEGSLEPLSALAVDVLSGANAPELVILSDGNLAGEDIAKKTLGPLKGLITRYLRVGKDARNFAITSFSVRRYPLDKTHHESIVTISSFAPKDERVRLSVRAASALLYDEVLDVPHGQSVTRTLADLAGADDALEASITPLAGKDALASDDRAFATLPPRARTRVLVVSEGNRYLEAALLLDEYLVVDEATPETYRGALEHDVVIFDRFVPRTTPERPAIYLGPKSSGAITVKGESPRPRFDRIERDHPLVRLGAFQDVNASRASQIALESGDHAIASTSEGVPLVLEGKRREVPFVALAIDVRESDLPLRAAWPLFLLGAIDRLAGNAESEILSGLAGDVVRVRLPEGAASAELSSQNGAHETLAARTGVVRVVRDRAGLYTLRAAGTSTRLAFNVAAAREGAIAPSDSLVHAAETTAQASASEGLLGERIWPWLVGLALLLLTSEWLTFHRRWTQ